MTKKRARYLASIAAALAILSAGAANAATTPHHWPAWQESESITTIAPMGTWIDDTEITLQTVMGKRRASVSPDQVRTAPTDSNCERFDAENGEGAAALILSRP